jgi:hypothetical protein
MSEEIQYYHVQRGRTKEIFVKRWIFVYSHIKLCSQISNRKRSSPVQPLPFGRCPVGTHDPGVSDRIISIKKQLSSNFNMFYRLHEKQDGTYN